jgi:hypothetical protein
MSRLFPNRALKNVSRIQGLLAAYFFALLMQTLLERELRQAMARAGERSRSPLPVDLALDGRGLAIVNDRPLKGTA